MIRFIICITILFGSITSCKNKEVRALNRSERKNLDTLFRNELDTLRKISNEWCDKEYEQMYEHAVDSIKNIQLNEIKELINR